MKSITRTKCVLKTHVVYPISKYNFKYSIRWMDFKDISQYFTCITGTKNPFCIYMMTSYNVNTI